MQDEGLRDSALDKEVLRVQKAVFKLAESGSKLESGDIRGASAILSEAWMSEFEIATSNIGSPAADLNSKLKDLKVDFY
jgi:hypothetical protein